MKLLYPPQSGRVNNTVFSVTRYGQVARGYSGQSNPRIELQQRNRQAFGAVSSSWRPLPPEKQNAWFLAAADAYTVSRMGRSTALNGYNYYVKVNAKRASKGLSLFELPPANVPSFQPNPVSELAITNNNGQISIKLHVPTPPAQTTLVSGAAGVSTGVRFVQHFTYLGMLPASEDGWSDITALYVARYGQPLAGEAVFIRICQHIDGWTDVPIQLRAVVPAA